MDLDDVTAVELRDALARGEVTSEEATTHALARAAADDSGAFVELTPEAALRRARQVDARFADGGPARPLHGLPVADKDLYRRAGTVTTYGSRGFLGQVADESDSITLLLDGLGAVSVGTTASPEFGYAGYTSSLAHGHTTIPGHPGLGAGGSSGGAAAAVAAGVLPVAPGSDAGGSVRIPAAACGVVGLKPSRGAVPVPSSGIMGWLATPGALGRSVADAALLLEALVGAPLLGAAQAPGPRRRVGMLRDFHPWRGVTDGPLGPEARAARTRAATVLADAGHVVSDVCGPELPGYAEAFQVLWHASAAELALTEEQVALLEPLTRHFVERGRALHPDRVARARSELAGLGERIVAAFDGFDVVLTPTTALTPRPVGWHGEDPDVNFRRQCEYTPHTSFVNVAGLPAASVPVLAIGDGLSMSVQVIGSPGGDATVVGIAAELEALAGNLHNS